MKKMTNRLLCILLTLCMLLSLFSGVYAAPSATEIITTPTGYDSAGDVAYNTVDGYRANWGARGEDCTFLSTYAQNFYTGSYTYAKLSAKSGSSSTSTVPSSALYSALQTLMVDNHTYNTRYGSTNSNDCKYVYQYTDCMRGDPTYVSTLYRGLTVSGPWDGGASYNQEHIWPQSKCIGGNSEDVGDIMHLRPANPSENSSRGNKSYGESSGYYDPGVSVRGDCARTVLYMYVRWGNTEYMWGTDGVIESVDVLLRWIEEDPVDTWEMGHNDAVQSITGTRNVFVDYPELAFRLFNKTVPSAMGTPSNGLSSGGSTGGDTGDTDFTAMAQLVTNTASLKAGDQIVIASLDFDYAMSTTQNTNNRGQADVTKSDNGLQYGADTQVLTLKNGSLSGTFALEAGSGQYLCAASSTGNYLRTTDTVGDNASWTISVNASGVANVVANGSYTRNTLCYNMGSDLFSCYAADNSMRDIAIYKLGTAGGDPVNPPSSDTDESSTVLVTNASALKAGTRIVIAALDYDYALSTTQNNNNRGQGAITKNGSAMTYGSDVEVLTLRTGSAAGTFFLETMDGNYLYAASSTSNHLKTAVSQSDNACWTISVDSSTGAAAILGAGTYTRNVMRYNTSSKIFSCYAANNTQKDICIYMLTAACSHSYTSRITTAATCTTNGVRTYTCSKCGGSYTETIAATGHSYSSKVTAPTCSSQGYTTYTCSGCGTSYKDNYTAASNHSYTSKVTTAPTCTSSGVRTYTCSKCGGSYTESIASTGHSYSSKVTAPTCTAQGYTTYTCTACGSSYKGSYTTAKGHSYVNGSCVTCGAVDPNYSGASVVPTLTLKYPTVSFEDMILMNVYYSAENTQDVVDMGLVTYETKPAVANVATADEVLSGYTLNPSDGFYFSTTNGIAPKDLGDNIHFAIYARLADGTYAYSKVASYSPKTYANSLLSTGTAEMKALVVAMLNYGAAAQSYFNYNTGSLMNGSLTAAQKALAASYSNSMITAVTQPSGTKVSNFVNDQTYTKRYPTISFEGAFCINYYFQPTLTVKGDVTMYVWSAEDYNSVSVLTKTNATDVVKMTATASGEYLGVVEGIAAKDLDKVVYVAFVYSDGTTEHCGGVVAYSIGAYCKSQAATTGTMAELAKACAVYGYYAKQLFG